METFLSYAATIAAFVAGYLIGRVPVPRKREFCGCGLAWSHTGKHAPAFLPEEQGLIYQPIGSPKITRSRIPTQPAKKSIKPPAIHRTMSRQKKS